MRRRSIYIVPLIVGLMAVSLGAKGSKPHFITSDTVNVTQLLADPPTFGSEENQDEVQLLLQLEKSRSEADIARIRSEDDFTVFAFSDVLGPWFTEQSCPQTAALFAQVESDSKICVNAAKKHWARPRPYTSIKELNPSGKLEKTASYPSGHSTRSMLYAEILANVFPDKRAALLERARQIGWDRVIACVHYPSDVAAGRVLGQAIAQAMLASPEFRADLADVKTELTQASQPVGAH